VVQGVEDSKVEEKQLRIKEIKGAKRLLKKNQNVMLNSFNDLVQNIDSVPSEKSYNPRKLFDEICYSI
jgi:hypothetical protein